MQRVRKLWWTVSPLGSKIEMGFALNFVISLKCHESFSPGVYTVDSLICETLFYVLAKAFMLHYMMPRTRHECVGH